MSEATFLSEYQATGLRLFAYEAMPEDTVLFLPRFPDPADFQSVADYERAVGGWFLGAWRITNLAPPAHEAEKKEMTNDPC